MRILAAIEMGMRNHEYVPAELIAKIGNLKGGETYKTIQKLLKNKFITHIGNKCKTSPTQAMATNSPSSAMIISLCRPSSREDSLKTYLAKLG